MQCIYDAYTNARGEPSLLKIRCAQCNHYLITYQKDGPGPLKRCYHDRIRHPNIDTTHDLICSSCNSIIGTLTIYEKENRPAYSMLSDTFIIEEITI